VPSFITRALLLFEISPPPQAQKLKIDGGPQKPISLFDHSAPGSQTDHVMETYKNLMWHVNFNGCLLLFSFVRYLGQYKSIYFATKWSAREKGTPLTNVNEN